MRPSDLISLNGHIFLLLTTDFFFRQDYSPGRYCVKAYQQRLLRRERIQVVI